MSFYRLVEFLNLAPNDGNMRRLGFRSSNLSNRYKFW